MCRSSQFQYQNTLKIKGFFVRLTSSKSHRNSMPDSLTLLFLPRINGAELLVDGSNVRSDSSAFLTLHRVVNVKTKAGEAVFGSRSRVSATGGIRFEVFTRDDKILEGIFRKDEEDEWRLECECECALDREDGGAVAEADVCVAVEGYMAALSERVSMKSKQKRSKRKQRKEGIERLEVIREENEAAEDESLGGCCCTCGGDVGSDGGDSGEICGPDCGMMDMDMEGVKWAVDLGLWVMCFGMGYLVSKASARSLRRLRIM